MIFFSTMTMRYFLCLSLPLLLLGGCASGGDMTGMAGTTGTGGIGGGSMPPPPGLGQGGPFPFPQGKTSGTCTITSVANAAAATTNAYAAWKGSFVTAAGAGGGVRVQSPQHSGGTVSEGIGYGMIAAVYMNDRPTFDGLWGYAKLHFDSKGLMNWKIDAGGSTAADGAGSATDADEDMAWALLMASDQWSSVAYLDAARGVINAMYATEIAGDGTLKPGDNWGGTTYYPDYFSPAYYRVFARATNNNNWSGIIINRNYELLAGVSGPYGLVPNGSDTATLATTSAYGYNACRMPWRMAMDWCFNGEPRAKAYLDKAGAFFNGIGAANLGDGYSNAGTQTSGNHNMAIIGPAGTAGMAGFPALLDGAFSFGVNGAGDGAYYTNTLRIVSMLMMSGNLLDYSKVP
jgi:endo-1,4-beta-D-glucanase Y